MPEAAEFSIERLALRSRTIRAIREWFHTRHFIEVETPVRVAAPPPELHIDAFASEEAYLRSSPELHLKRLVAAGAERLFELGPCFRRGERGSLHNPEYTMLEWYRAGTDYQGVLEDCRALLREVSVEVFGSSVVTFGDTSVDLSKKWNEVSVRDAFGEYAGWDPVTSFDEDRFDLDFVNRVLPQLAQDVPVILKDYPVEAAALARCTDAVPPYAERWELLIGGVEIANAYSELCDVHEQRRRFEHWNAQRLAAGREAYPVDETFMAALEQGLPACGGVALGIDRLIMVLAGETTIDTARPFCTPSPEIT